MDNPWTALPEQPPYLLPADQAPILAFNRQVHPAHQIRHELLPEPYLGRPDADIVLLNLNPGYSPEDAAFQAQPPFRELWRKNLRHLPAANPFYLLDPALDKTKNGAAWWSRILKRPLQQAGRKRVANRFQCVEYFPYHSRRFRGMKTTLPSQAYSFFLIEQAIKRRAVIILMRSRRIWLKAVPQLVDYDRRFELRSPQNPTISPRNCPQGYALIADILQSG